MGDTNSTWITGVIHQMIKNCSAFDKTVDRAIRSVDAAAQRVGSVTTVIGSAVATVAARKQVADSIQRALDGRQLEGTANRMLGGAMARSGAVIAAGVKKHAADLAAEKLTPRERAYTAIDRMLLLDLLEFDIGRLKDLAAMKSLLSQPGTAGAISPSNWVLSHVYRVQLWSKDIQPSLRRLSAVDGVDAAISSVLRVVSKRVHDRTMVAALTQEAAPSQAGDSIDGYLVYAENRVVRHILEKMVRRYSASSSPFELSRALGDVVGELALNNMKSITRVRELTELHNHVGSLNPLTAYYAALYSRINSAK